MGRARAGRAYAPRLAVLLAATGLLVTACSGSAATGDSGSPSAPALSSPAASTSASPAPSSTPPSPGTASDAVTGLPREVPPQFLGTHVELVQAGRWPKAPVGSVRLWDNRTSWNVVEPARGRYDWTTLDKAVATAESHGVRDITLVLGGTPEWAATTSKADDYPGPGAPSVPTDFDAWSEYVSAVAARYAGRISAYEVWNEGDLSRMWRGTPEQMADLTERAATAIRAADPKATVVGASTSMRTAGYDRFFPAYLAALAARQWPVDVLAVHSYPASLGTPLDRAQNLVRAKADIAKAGAPARLGLWDTEVNYGIAGPGLANPHRDITGEAAAGWVVRTYLDSLRLGVDRTYWYIQTPKAYPLLGVQTDDGSAGAQGMRTAYEWLAGSTLASCDEAAGAVVCRVTGKAGPATIAWAVTGEAATSVPAGAKQRCDALGRCAPVSAGATVPLTVSPIRLA